MNYIHGFHVGSWSDHIGAYLTTTGAHLMGDRPGTLVFTEIVGNGHDYSVWHDAGYTVLVRLNYSYGDGTIPPIAQYGEFAQRCAVMVAASRGVDGWIIGNEPNHDGEGGIAAEDYAACFELCQDAIQTTTPDARVLIAGIAPYNADSGDWVTYLGAVLAWIGDSCDGIALHAYTHGHDPALITSEATMDPPYQYRHFEFRAYRDFMSVIPDGTPVWITESNPGADPDNKAWENTNNGWVKEAYAEINNWNRHHPARQIRGLCLYRYPRIDEWWIQGKTGVEDDFLAAVAMGYEWTEEDQPMAMRTLYQSSFEEGFHTPLGDSEVTVPVGWLPAWDADYGPRPEFTSKDVNTGETEVRTGRYAANFFHVSATWKGAIYKEFSTSPGAAVRVSVYCMGVADGVEAGASIGIFHDTDFFSDDGVYQEWVSPYDEAYQDRVWKLITAEGHADNNGNFVVALYGKTDFAIPGWHTHWDDIKVEVEDDGTDPPPTGTWRNVTYDPAGNIVGEYSFEGPSVNPQICALVQQIVGLTCP